MAKGNKAHLARVQGVVGSEARVRQVSLGYVGGHPTTLTWKGLGIAALIEVALFLATGGAVVVGGMGVVLIVFACREIYGKPHWVASTDQGLALVSKSRLGKPKTLVARIGYRQPQGLPAQGKWVHVPFGPQRVWLRRDQLSASGI